MKWLMPTTTALAVILKHLMGVIDVAMLIDQCVTA